MATGRVRQLSFLRQHLLPWTSVSCQRGGVINEINQKYLATVPTIVSTKAASPQVQLDHDPQREIRRNEIKGREAFLFRVLFFALLPIYRTPG